MSGDGPDAHPGSGSGSPPRLPSRLAISLQAVRWCLSGRCWWQLERGREEDCWWPETLVWGWYLFSQLCFREEWETVYRMSSTPFSLLHFFFPNEQEPSGFFFSLHVWGMDTLRGHPSPDFASPRDGPGWRAWAIRGGKVCLTGRPSRACVQMSCFPELPCHRSLSFLAPLFWVKDKERGGALKWAF